VRKGEGADEVGSTHAATSSRTGSAASSGPKHSDTATGHDEVGKHNATGASYATTAAGA